MANMAYCRFQNTVKDLQDCYDHICDDLHSDSELRAHARLVALCKSIAAEFGDEAEDAFDELEEQLEAANARITELQATNEQLLSQLAATIATIEATVSAYQISENQRLDAIPEATGADYAEGCAP